MHRNALLAALIALGVAWGAQAQILGPMCSVDGGKHWYPAREYGICYTADAPVVASDGRPTPTTTPTQTCHCEMGTGCNDMRQGSCPTPTP